MSQLSTLPNRPPLVSVVLPTYNRLGRLKQVLAGLERQDYACGDFEVIVVSDGSTDGTHEYMRTLETSLRLRFITQANQGAAAARNQGVAAACGEMVLFIDDDVVPTPSLITEHMREHAAANDDVVVLGPMLTPDDFVMSPWVRWEQAMLDKQYTAMCSGKWQPSPRQFYTGNTSLARRHLVAAGGFDVTFRRAEDVELAYRLAQRGLRFVFTMQAVGYHYAERSFGSWIDIPYAYGRNDVIFAFHKQQTWILPTVRKEFRRRHPLIRMLVHLCLGRRLLSRWMLHTLKFLSEFGQRLGRERLPHFVFSGMFNMRYYQGMADELGGREKFASYVW